MERKTLDIAELKEIRFDLGGIISFHHPSTGTTYTWMAPPGEGREVVMTNLLGELRKAEKVELVVYSPKKDGGGSEFIVQRMTLIYNTLK